MKKRTHCSEKHKQKTREAHKKSGLMPPSRKGVKLSDEIKKRIGDGGRGISKPNSGCWGEKNYLWKGGITKNKEYRSWIKNKRNRMPKIGGHTFAEWEILKAQYNWTCPACKKKEPEIKLSQDHIIPLSKGGSDNIENIQPLCKSCNCRKHTKVIKYL